MAAPIVTTKMLLLIGDGADPEVFGAPCGATSRNVTFSRNLSEQALIDCDDDTLPSFVTRQVISDDTSFSFDGLIALQFWPTWQEWIDSTGSAAIKNMRIFMDVANADGGGHWELPSILENFTLTRQGTDNVAFTASVQGAGARVWTPAV